MSSPARPSDARRAARLFNITRRRITLLCLVLSSVAVCAALYVSAGAAGGGGLPARVAGRSGKATANSAALVAAGDTTQNITQAGNYRITVRGANGGNSSDGLVLGGSGATVAATFALQSGDALTLVTGIAGSNGGLVMETQAEAVAARR